ncbi:XdhC family protein [Tamlana fucoidanivorans]|uniref:XdhC family protein n=1 Tax=Allotamlana fucoidanivorans TaxID=2583814 RepID=A0A5C4SGY5_9FLAO|nr:XdhC/CoxI family protein [Tamlana fucoidanivorans]TNJ42907.1 XdhC family protein [Tamlana fucoidanivorans]
MTHEFKKIVFEAMNAKTKGLKSVLASVVALDGSSYRRPGVRMLILENGKMIGAVSGGCVEKEVLLQSESVFKTGVSKVMTYDGRYRLGCEGVLYILIESFSPSNQFFESFKSILKTRKTFKMVSHFNKIAEESPYFGSLVRIEDKVLSLNKKHEPKDITGNMLFEESMPPCFKLMIIGAEHDAVQLCQYASLTGWEVSVLAGHSEHKSITDFPGALSLQAITPEMANFQQVDQQTSVVLMTHNFAYDLRYLVALKDTLPNYIGLLGPTKRRDDLLSQFIEYVPNISDDFLEKIHGPAGLNVGSETPQEIAISIVSEILAFTRNQEPMSLTKKVGNIHSKPE